MKQLKLGMTRGSDIGVDTGRFDLSKYLTFVPHPTFKTIMSRTFSVISKKKKLRRADKMVKVQKVRFYINCNFVGKTKEYYSALSKRVV